MKLAISKGYPWRASLTKKARCDTCKYICGTWLCSKGRILLYPLYAKTHDCPDFSFKPSQQRGGPYNEFEELSYPECKDCGHNFEGLFCDGKRWLPVNFVENKCEFFRHEGLICKNAIPYLQYGNQLRNHYCKLPPYKRDGDQKQGWSWNCPHANSLGIERTRCYKPRVVESAVKVELIATILTEDDTEEKNAARLILQKVML